MTLKNLRDYLNSLNLDEVQSMVEVVYVTKDACVCEEMVHFQLNFPDCGCKPYLSIYCDSFIQDLEKNDNIFKEKEDE